MEYNLFDIIIVALLAISFFYGFKRGFIMGIFELIGILLSFFISYNYSYIIHDVLIKVTGIFEFIKNNVADKLTKLFESQVVDDLGGVFKGFEKLPFDIQRLLNDFVFKDAMNENISNYIENLADRIAAIFVYVISFAITFLVVYLVLMIAANILNTMFKAPVLSTINKLFGGGLGLIKTIILIYIFFVIASPFISMSKPDNGLTTTILESRSSEYFYQNNIILNYLTYKGILKK
ncbi:MAG: Uncharacterized protein XD91_0989 [Clostridiales bacterium 38_11]|nr:MAG: Uncharacterized protein XD91_0989 [Clostridiales bacterium 38_11]HBH12278.1 hypothetical protein [Clostridiales bacterium]